MTAQRQPQGILRARFTDRSLTPGQLRLVVAPELFKMSNSLRFARQVHEVIAATPMFLDLRQLTSLSNRSQACGRRMEHGKQHEHAAFVKVQLAFVRFVSSTCFVVESLQQRNE